MSATSFSQTIRQHKLKLDRNNVKTLQVNLGKLCNQACRHCHVDAGPTKTVENMHENTITRILYLLDQKNESLIETIDITGGAPELNPHFRFLVKECHKREIKVIDRCNLTVLFEPGQEDTALFLKDYKVRIVASLPCYNEDNVDAQRGSGVFQKSIKALQILNNLGYGKDNSSLQLDLVYNPQGPFLPPNQKSLEQSYKNMLKDRFGIIFNELLTITNMPIARFIQNLRRQGQDQQYMNLLRENFNPHTLPYLMCRDLLSIGWDGSLFDCDFNQMLKLPLGAGPKTIWDIEDFNFLSGNPICVKDHCFGCTAGSGSSCGGAVT